MRHPTTASWLGIAVAILSMGTGVAFAAPAPHTSAASCYGVTCRGHDPHRYGCQVTSTTSAVYTTAQGTVTMRNRYSAGCRAKWTEATMDSGAQAAGWQVQFSTWALNAARTGAVGESCFPGPRDTGATWEPCDGTYYAGASGWPAWTDMVNGTDYAEGPLSVFDASGTFLGQIWANQ